MDGLLSHGLAPLAASGNRIVAVPSGQPLRLRGVCRSGLEYSEPDEDGFLSAAGVTRLEIEHITRAWRANILRIPFNQDWALRGRRNFTSEHYLSSLDRIVSWAARSGAYTLLDLQWLDADQPFGPKRQFVPPLPNPRTPELWALLARRYRSEPAVLFDLFNEPHDRMPGDPFPLHRPDGTLYPAHHRRVSMEEWQPWARLLIDVIRAEHPQALVFVSGVNWGFDLAGFPLDRANLVYSTHVYPNKGLDWDNAFGNLAWQSPVFAAEFGGGPDDLEWGRSLLAYFDERAMGWTAWSWQDRPHLIERYHPTPFGEIVQARLKS